MSSNEKHASIETVLILGSQKVDIGEVVRREENVERDGRVDHGRVCINPPTMFLVA